MANDNLSGVITTAFLAKQILDGGTPEYSWRFLFLPETIGPLAYLSEHRDIVSNLNGGLVVSCCGGPGPIGYKQTYLGDHIIDRAIEIARIAARKIGPRRAIIGHEHRIADKGRIAHDIGDVGRGMAGNVERDQRYLADH